jgi:hypothetical protein
VRTVPRYPRGAWRPLGPQTEPRMDRVDIICVHTMVGFLASTETMFRAGGYSGTESHFGIGGRWGADGRAGLDGVVWQWQDLDRQADANLDGAHRCVSIETADNAPRAAADILPWTPKQVASLVDLIAWLCVTFDVPPVLVQDSRPGRRGLAFHRQGVDPWRVSGGERWSSARGKECPGPARIRQFTGEVIPAVRAKVLQVTARPDRSTPEDDMPKLDDVIDLGKGQSAVLGEADGKVTVEQAMAIQTAALVEIQRGQERLIAAVDAIASALRDRP